LFSTSGVIPPGSPELMLRGRARRRVGNKPADYVPVPETQPWELPRDVVGVNSILNAIWVKEGFWGIWKGCYSLSLRKRTKNRDEFDVFIFGVV
jgi:hypothetical protein